MNKTKFYQPDLAKLTGHELMFAQESLDAHYRRGTNLDVPDFDFAAPSSQYPVMTRRVALKGNNTADSFEPAFFDMGPFQITYNFSRAVRNNNFPLRAALPLQPKAAGEYGAAGWTYRLLYEFLSETYNNGTPFVDTYFNSVFNTRSVYDEFMRIYDTIQSDINEEQLRIFSALPLKKDGTPDMRYTVSKKYQNFKVWQDPIVRQDCKNLAAKIRHDVEVCLSTSRIPLRKQTVSKAARERRADLAGLHPDQLFFASGRLIRHLNIYIEVGNAAAVSRFLDRRGMAV
jgi:hypothetical protein